MSVDENLGRAPEAPAVNRPALGPRPFRVFLAGAACIGGGVPFLLLAVGGCRGLVLLGIGAGWLEILTTRRGLWALAITLLCGSCGVALVMAGRSFLGRQGQQGRRTLLAFAILILSLFALFALFALFTAS